MCVRLSPSHPAARIVVGLYIFLATFLVGFFFVKALPSFETYFLSTPAITDEVKSPLEFDIDRNSPKPCELIVSKLYEHMAKQQSINIYNDGTKTVYLDYVSINELVDFSSDTIPTSRSGDLLWVHETELRPGWAQAVYSPHVDVEARFSLTVGYRTAKTGRKHIVTALFEAKADIPMRCVTEDLGDQP